MDGMALCWVADLLKNIWFYGLIAIMIGYRPKKEEKADLIKKGAVLLAWIIIGIIAVIYSRGCYVIEMGLA